MQLFTLLDARTRGELPRRSSVFSSHASCHLCVIPATAGLGHVCDYVQLGAGECLPLSAPDHAGWWACLEGGVRVLDGEAECAVLASGDVLASDADSPSHLQAMVGSVLVCTMSSRSGDAAGSGEFVALEPGEADWAQRFQARGLVWAACHHGNLCLQWRNGGSAAEIHTTYLQPGMAFAPEPGDDYCIDAMVPGSGLLCCLRPARTVIALAPTARAAQDPPRLYAVAAAA